MAKAPDHAQRRGADLLGTFQEKRDLFWVELSQAEYVQAVQEYPRPFFITGSQMGEGDLCEESWLIRHVPGHPAIMRHWVDDGKRRGFEWFIERWNDGTETNEG